MRPLVHVASAALCFGTGLVGCSTASVVPASRVPAQAAVHITRSAPVRPPVSASPPTASDAGPEAAPVAATVEPSPPPPPPLFEGQESVTYTAFLDEVRRVADELSAAPEVVAGYQRLLADNRLTESDVSLESYSRVRLAFEATRDGGLWGIRWNVTDEMPWSDEIWKQWAARDWSGEPPDITAQAECDELSALFSVLARDLGTQGFVGLFWPAWNHTVAVWELTRHVSGSSKGEQVRILIPTSQIWLSREATLGTREMKANRVVFPYQRKDLEPDGLIPAPVARHLIGQLRTYGAWSSERLLERRNRLGGS